MKELKNEIKSADSNQDLQEKISYKKWHAVKLIAASAEGFAITDTNNIKIDIITYSKLEINKTELENAKIHNKRAEEIFTDLLNLKENSDFDDAEKRLIQGYEDVETVLTIIKSITMPRKSK